MTGAPCGPAGSERAPDPVIGETELAELEGVPDIAAVEQHRGAEQGLQALEVRPPEVVPLGHQHERIAARRRGMT